MKKNKKLIQTNHREFKKLQKIHKMKVIENHRTSRNVENH